MKKLNLNLIVTFTFATLLAGVAQASNPTPAPAPPAVGDYLFSDGQCQKIVQIGKTSVACDNTVGFHYAEYAAGPSYAYLEDSQYCVLIVSPEGHPKCEQPKPAQGGAESTGASNSGGESPSGSENPPEDDAPNGNN